ncbi:hypothetical protein V1264_021047 [Littorina saxatilis]|uniref:Chitin-binding type-2 domain-containing protein n=2 Tax=Littorina saxatilis TaxID=31220 RepID=A0AAN9GCW5_9CAEN
MASHIYQEILAIFGLAVLFCSTVTADHFQPVCRSQVGFLRHPQNCSLYFMCIRGVPSPPLSCPPGFVFSIRYSVCLPVDTLFNDCYVSRTTKSSPPTTTTTTTTTSTPTLSVEERCQMDRTAVFPHPGQCQLFYNCSNDAQPDWPSFFDRYLDECEYPLLFNAVTSRCEDFHDVTCGDRVEHVNRCSYLRSKCVTSHCVPCWVRFATCSDLPDGMNVFVGREWTPYYAICKDNRSLGFDVCPFNDTLKIPEFFSPDQGECVSLYEVPREHSGYQLDCSTRDDGLYLDDVTSRPDLYYRCHGGHLTEINVCPSGERFDKATDLCVSLGI